MSRTEGPRLAEGDYVDLIRVHVADPTAQSIASTVARLMREGAIRDGARLPTVRELAAVFHVSPGTISQAWALLRKRGLAHGRGKAGVVVSTSWPGEPRGGPAMHAGARDLRYITPDPALLPSRLTLALQEALQIPDVNTYSTIPILPDLRDVISEDWPFRAQAFLAVNGGADGVYLTLQSLTVPGDRVVVPEPAAPTMLLMLRELSLIGVPVPEDSEGPRVEGMRRAMSAHPAVVCLQPRAAVPTGRTISASRLADLTHILRRSSANIIELDDLHQLSAADSPSFGSVLPERTLLIRSFSKSHGPDLRVGVIGGSADHIRSIRTRISTGRRWGSKIMQGAVAWMLRDAQSIVEVQQARRIYSSRLNALLDALGLPTGSHVSTCGLCLWLPVAEEEEAVRHLECHAYKVLPGSTHFVLRPRPHIRVATSRLTEDVDNLAALLQSVRA